MPPLVRRAMIKFGKIDAKNALVTRDPQAKALFLESFALPEQEDMAAIRSGDKFFIHGTKGSGKTALLRYLKEEEDKKGNATKFVIFSEDISRQELDRLIDGDIETVDKPDIENATDVRDMWLIYIVKNICEMLVSRKDIFDDDSKCSKLLKLIDAALDDSKRGALSSIFKSLKSGKLRIAGNVSEFAEFEATFNFEANGNVSTINYSKFADLAAKTLCSLSYPDDVRYSLFIDEINLSMLQQKQHRKDSILIRDLILCIGKANRLFVEANVPLFIYAALRSEVAKASNISRNEIEKYLTDNGYRTNWHDGFNVGNYKIFSIVEKRIAAVEKVNVKRSTSKDVIWSQYFARDIFGMHPKKFISEITWCNPRDIVNLFNLASEADDRRSLYDTQIFLEVADRYSEAVWSERAEELNTEYSMTVVNAVKKLLSGFHDHFKVSVLQRHAEGLANSNGVIQQIMSTVGIEKICRDLYYVGVLGQSTKVSGDVNLNMDLKRNQIDETWFYRDNREFNDSNWLIVHKGLYPALKIRRWSANVFGQDPRFTVS